MQIGLIGGVDIEKYSIADRIWSVILSQHDTNSHFLYYPTVKKSDVYRLLENVRNSEIKGFNVALPWKSVVAEYCDVTTPVVEMTGFANVVYSKNDKLIADNTDGVGFIAGLKKIPKSALIYGAGGAGVVLAYELSCLGSSVTIVDVDNEKICYFNKKCANWLSADLVIVKDPNSIEPASFEMVVNATPLGKKNHVSNESSVSYSDQSPIPSDYISAFKKGTLFAEMNYYPLKTKFIDDAESHGMEVQFGIAMLFHQAAMTYELYSGKKTEAPINFNTFYLDIFSLNKN